MGNNVKEQLQARFFDEVAIDFGHYWAVIKRNLFYVVVFALVMSGVAVWAAKQLTPMYLSTVSILVESKAASPVSVEEIYGFDASKKEYMKTQFEILRSRKIAEKTVRRMELHNNPIFMPESSTPSLMSQVRGWVSEVTGGAETPSARLSEEEINNAKVKATAAKLLSSVAIVLVKDTQIMELSVSSPSAELSSQIANTMADVYVENYFQEKVEMTTKATNFLTESISGLRTKLDKAEQKLSSFYEENQVVNIDGVTGLAGDRLSQLNSQLMTAQHELEANRAIYERTRQQVDRETMYSLPAILNHPAIQRTRDEELKAVRKVSELEKTYGPKHPVMVAAQAELIAIRGALESQVDELLSSIGTQYQSALERVSKLQTEVQVAEENYRRLTGLETTRSALQREVSVNQQLYDSFFSRLQETSEIMDFESSNARILDVAEVPAFPSKPNKPLIVIATFIASFGLGVVVALGLDMSNSTVRTPEDVERKLGQRMLGILPLIKGNKLALRTYFDGSNHQFSESIRTLRSSLSLLNIERQNKCIIVTSTLPQEGKSTVATNLAFALGQIEETLIIDADLRRPSIAKLFGLPKYQPGLSNLIMATHSLDECVVKDEESGLHVISAGTVPDHAQELLDSEAFANCIKALKSKYKYVVLDSAPSQSVADSLVASKVCDSVIYVVKAHDTSENLVSNGISRFLRIGSRVDGVVLNQVNVKKYSKYDSYAGYYDEYEYGKS
ncbi:chain-length determining protein [Alteromonas confluentis]|uniref:non-specific protein-tyrosine kinase n=1 Tax=Alteromonas confluentis TaxID=1656094 RepID=A0A1E7Z8Z4_9ALTE|nr:chain-length determining protein [Alteromonas confluentis]